ncbi:trypsin-like peptidase domain-containing protein [candidate division WOR-3 bacterium]|nr:trypsin-like peptidase domain-containing protein [candidate division WOR-3 bacterium]
MGELTSIIEAIKPSIVVLKSGQNKSGTGFFVNSKGLFVTNKHTVKLSTYITIALNDGTEKHATVVLADNDVDFAFAIADIERSTPIPLANSSTIQEGQQVIAIGHPYGYDFTVSKGIVSCKDRIVKGIHYIQTDVPINPGNSGGPLIDINGAAIGINTWVVGDADNMSFAIPAASVKPILERIDQEFDSLMNMYYCPICGCLDREFITTKKAEYCRSCGAQKWDKSKEKEQALTGGVQSPAAQPVKAAMATCPHCKTQIAASAKFCSNCGQKLG